MPSLRKRRKTFRRYSIRKVPTGTRVGRKDEEAFEVPEHPQVQELGDQREREIHRIIGGQYKEARQVYDLELDNPTLTLPEVVTMNWLNAQSVNYVPQAYVMGGRSRQGGQVPDFLVRFGPDWAAWLVQGNWYHSSSFQQQYLQEGRDLAAKLALEGSRYAGFQIKKVVTLQEEDIYKERPLIFDLAMAGQELP
jgi:hypothetical protein